MVCCQRIDGLAVVVVIVVAQWSRSADFDRSDDRAGDGIVEAQNAAGSCRRSAEIADVDVIMAVESHGGWNA